MIMIQGLLSTGLVLAAMYFRARLNKSREREAQEKQEAKEAAKKAAARGKGGKRKRK